jgi:hypothetical protein
VRLVPVAGPEQRMWKWRSASRLVETVAEKERLSYLVPKPLFSAAPLGQVPPLVRMPQQVALFWPPSTPVVRFSVLLRPVGLWRLLLLSRAARALKEPPRIFWARAGPPFCCLTPKLQQM